MANKDPAFAVPWKWKSIPRRLLLYGNEVKKKNLVVFKG